MQDLKAYLQKQFYKIEGLNFNCAMPGLYSFIITCCLKRWLKSGKDLRVETEKL